MRASGRHSEERDVKTPDVAQDAQQQEALDAQVDEAGMESFPASDPPSFWAR